MTCKRAAHALEGNFVKEIQDLSAKYQKSDFAVASAGDSTASMFDPSSHGRVNHILSINIQNAFQSQIGITKPAINIIKQQMMINAMHNFSDDYGFVRAASTQESSWRLSGDLSTIYLPMLLTVMKGIFYASFIFLVPIMLLSGGMHKYLGYLSIIASLQLWPALNSILNMFIDLYSSQTLAGISGNVVSFATSSKVGDYTDKIVAVASGLQMVVPFLAFGIIQGGVSGFMNIAGTITGATQSAASSVAHEVTTGNRSLDNVSLNNMQVAMQSGFKTDLNSSYVSSASSYQHADGTLEKTLGSGETIYTAGSGITTSSGATNIETRILGSSQTSDTYSALSSMAKSSQVAFTDQETATLNHALNSLTSLSKHDEAGTNIALDKNSSESKITQQAQNYMRHLRDTFGYSHEQAAAAYLKASLDLDLGSGKNGAGSTDTNTLTKLARKGMSKVLGNILPSFIAPNINGDAGGSFTASNSDSQALSSETASSIDNSHIVAYSALETALASNHYTSSDSRDKTLADDLRASREHTKQLGQTVDIRREDLQSFGNNITNSSSKEMIVTHEARDALVKQVAECYNIHPLEAHRALESGHQVVSPILKAKNRDVTRDSDGSMQSAKQYFMEAGRDTELDDFKEERKHNIDGATSSSFDEVRQNASNVGVEPVTANKAINDVKENIQSRTEALNKATSDELKIKEKALRMEYREHHGKVKKAEGKRRFTDYIGRKNERN
jgi:hypothetical protein